MLKQLLKIFVYIALFFCVETFQKTDFDLIPKDSLEYLEQLKQIRDDIIDDWGTSSESRTTTIPSLEHNHPTAEKENPYYSYTTDDNGVDSIIWQPPKKALPLTSPEKNRKRTGTILRPRSEFETTKTELVVSSGGSGSEDKDHNVHTDNGGNFSSFALVILAFLPAFTGILVCGTLVVAIFAKASQPGSPEQVFRNKINEIGFFDGVQSEIQQQHSSGYYFGGDEEDVRYNNWGGRGRESGSRGDIENGVNPKKVRVNNQILRKTGSIYPVRKKTKKYRQRKNKIGKKTRYKK